MPEQLKEAPTLNSCVSHLWEIFLKIHRRRSNNGFGPSAITYSELEAYSRISQTKLDVWEIEALLSVDDIYLIINAKQSKSGTSNNVN